MSAVQQKISCIYETAVTDEPSNKRPQQFFKVSATGNLLKHIDIEQLFSAKATEKLDGTCCLITEFKGKPWLWARHDRKPTKCGEKRFAQYKKKLKNTVTETEGYSSQSEFVWDPAKDFKDVPENWKPADGHRVKDGVVMPDSIGHTPGWIPVLPSSRTHCWHLTAVNYTHGTALVLREREDSDDDNLDLCIECQPLSQLCGRTFELIGTNINGNPYNLGSKKFPFHLLVRHGSLRLACPCPTDYEATLAWMTSEESESNRVEGVVWHCKNGQMFKLHRHHLNLRWPDKIPRLCQRKVKVQGFNVDESGIGDESSTKSTNLFTALTSLNNHEFESLQALCQAIFSENV